jgi:hypothetical protein
MEMSHRRTLLEKRDAPGSMVLHRWQIGEQWWLVDASVTENGDLVISSGDAETEWQAIVHAADLDALATALVTSIHWQISPDAGILDLLYARFWRAGSNPFDEIKRFLSDNAIAWQSQVW